MRTPFLIVSLLLTLSLCAQGIEFFHGTWEEALALAAQEDKPIFVDAYASWCGPCKQMTANVFPQAEVGAVFNANFINLKLDMEKPEAVNFKSKHPVRAYPTLFFVNAQGEVLHTVVGGQQPESLINHARAALTKAEDVSVYQSRYAAGERDPDLVYRYVRALVRQGEPHLKIANDQLRDQADNLQAPGNLRLMLLAATEADSRIFDLLLANRTAVEALTSPAAFERQVKLAFANTQAKALQLNSGKLLDVAAKKYQSFDPAAAQTFLLEGQLAQSLQNQDPKAAAKAAKAYHQKVAKGQAPALTALFKQLTENPLSTKDPKLEKLTAEIGQQAADLTQDYRDYYLLAKWLHDAGDPTAALAAAERSKALVPADQPNSLRLLDYLINQIKG